MAGPSSFGVCESCGSRKGKAAMAAHLKQCLPLSIGNGPRVPVMLLRVHQAGSPVFWLQVAAAMDARLGQIDDLLRRVWLECCGHMSEFYRNRRDEVDMNSSEELGNRLEIEAEMAEEELEVETYQDI